MLPNLRQQVITHITIAEAELRNKPHMSDFVALSFRYLFLSAQIRLLGVD